jgi:hypothetical protein
MTLFFTIATTNYLPFAVSLLDSVKQHHPEFEVCICLTDYLTPATIAKNKLMEKYPILQLHELQAEEFGFITQNYSPMELANSAKILFAEHFLSREEVDQVVFCDSDIRFFGRLPENVIAEHDIVYTPHYTSPPPIEMKRQELEVLNAGMFNGGFFKLKKSAETMKFIKWFRERCVLECISDRCRGYYYDQLWINFVPLYFKNVNIERNPGMNMAYWNLHERQLSQKNGVFMVNDQSPLSFFHFSGWDYNDPLNITKWSLFTAEQRPDVKPLLSAYYKALQENEYEHYITMPNHYTAHNKSQKKSFFKKLKHQLFKRKNK